VRQVILVYAAGRIELETPPALAARNLRYTPSFLLGATAGPRAPYTATTVADFLGWSEDKVGRQLSALELIEQGAFQSHDFHGMTGKQATAAVTGVRQAERHAQRLGIG